MVCPHCCVLGTRIPETKHCIACRSYHNMGKSKDEETISGPISFVEH